MGRGLNKAERLKEMERLYAQRAYSDIEMAERLSTAEHRVDRTTVFRDRSELETQVPFTRDADGRYGIDRGQYLPNIRLNLCEGLSLYLAARRSSQQTHSAQKHTASALEKLALTLKQPMTARLVQAADVILQQKARPERDKVFEVVADAWVQGLRLRVDYQGLQAKRPYEDLISPYLIEPSPWSDSVYVIGPSDHLRKIVAYKLDRIQRATLTGEGFRLPEDFDEQELLRHAWGIWRGEGEPEIVRLKFAPGATRRVRESVWHPLEEVTATENGGCIWQAPIAEWVEMLPWVKGWGADVEVLGPEGLRQVLRREAERLAEMYEIAAVKSHLVAHIRKRDGERQPLEDHLREVSRLTGQFAGKIGLRETGEALGLLHDLGKASQEFQNYLLSAEGFLDPDADEYVDPKTKRGKIDHSTAGAQVVCETLMSRGGKEKAAAQVLALCLASHHSGLIDCLAPDGEDNFRRRMGKSDEKTHKGEVTANLQDIENTFEAILSHGVIDQLIARVTGLWRVDRNDSQSTLMFKAGLLIRYLLSCLLDADRLDTADFESPGNRRIRNYGEYQPWGLLVDRLERKFAEFAAKAPEVGEAATVNQLRNEVAQACLDAAAKPRGIYQLTVPTGGGKTFSSLRFALNHAAHHKLDRVFYVIPYTSIIDQNADEVRKILEDKDANGAFLDRVVLEHHSNLTPEEESHRQGLLAENWDAPVVFTTQVQFLEALFGAGTRSARRMHQLANSVIILDEVQTIPINMIHILNVALRFLVDDCGATVVLCTATQPPLDKVGTKYRDLTIPPDGKIVQNEQELFEKLRRVQVFDERRAGGWRAEEVADLAERQLAEKGSVLIVVNTKRSARALYVAVRDRQIADVHLCHLSTSMCPAHRLDVLQDIRGRLERGEPVICVSTQLIEAGVDIDFGAVIRYLAGLDSIAQAAGRCNRNGARPGLGNVWVLNPAEESLAQLKEISEGSDVANRVLDDFVDEPDAFGHDRIGLEAMAHYYRCYFARRLTEMDYPVAANSSVGHADDLFNLLSLNTLSVRAYQRTHNATPEFEFRQSFQTAAREFRVIDSVTQGVVVPYADGDEIINELRSAPELEKEYRLLRKAQRYSVNLFAHEFKRLALAGAIQELQEGAGVYYLDEQHYSNDFGWSDEIVNVMKFHCV